MTTVIQPAGQTWEEAVPEAADPRYRQVFESALMLVVANEVYGGMSDKHAIFRKIVWNLIEQPPRGENVAMDLGLLWTIHFVRRILDTPHRSYKEYNIGRSAVSSGS